MKSKLIVITLIVVLISIMNSETTAQVQRMGILHGNYNIGPSSSIRVKTFCVDPDRSVPSETSSFSHSLLPDQKAKVIFSKRTMSLQDAINGYLIEIRGINLMGSIKDTVLIKSLSEEDRAYFLFAVDIIENPGKITFKKLLKIYDYPLMRRAISDEELQMIDEVKTEYESMSSVEKTMMDSFLSAWMSMFLEPLIQELRISGDYSGLRFINKTNKPIRIELSESIILGEDSEGIDELNKVIDYLNNLSKDD